MIEQKIRQSIVLDRVVPQYVSDEFPKFVEFVRAYYKWLETENGLTDKLNKFLSNQAIDTVDDSDQQFLILETFMKSIPKNLSIDYSLLLHNIREFYSTKGTAGSIQAFFQLLAEVYKPNRIVIYYTGNEDLLAGEIVCGSSSGAKATIISVLRPTPDSAYVIANVTYSTEAAYKGKFFTSNDTLIMEDETRLAVRVEDLTTTVTYPKQFILRASDGEYITDKRVRIKLTAGVYTDFTSKSFTTSSGNIGRVDKQSYSLHSDGTYDYYELVLSFSTYLGWDQDTESLTINSTPVPMARVMVGTTITNAGNNYATGEQYDVLDAGSNVVGYVLVDEVVRSRVDTILIQDAGEDYSVGDRFRFKYSFGYYGGGIVSEVSGGIITKLTIEHSLKNSSEFPDIEFVDGNDSAVLVAYNSTIGALSKVTVETVGFDVPSSGLYVQLPAKDSPYAAGAVTVQSGTLFETRRRFKDERGQLSSYYRLQDNNYWQDYSYVVQFNKPIDFSQYSDLYKKIVHPAGMKAFFEYRSTNEDTLLDLTNSADSFRYIIKETMMSGTVYDYHDMTQEQVERIKDTNPFKVLAYNIHLGESPIASVFDKYLRFPSDGITIDELSDFETLHKYTCSVECHPIYQLQSA